MYNIERGALIMAKKNYTPEEMQAKMAKKSDNCKLFFVSLFENRNWNYSKRT